MKFSLKTIFIAILISFFTFSLCYAIDESEIYDNSSENNAVSVTSSSNYNVTEQESSTSTIVSGVSSMSDYSTITNILNIALIVVGILLILLAIAILIRLKK